MPLLAKTAIAAAVIAPWPGMFNAPSEAQTLAYSFTVTPDTVANGGTVHINGNASCAYVVFTGHPGALGIRTIGPITVAVTDGLFATDVRLPRFEADKSRPGLYDEQTLEMSCEDSGQALAKATIHITGIKLPEGGWSVQAVLVVAAIVAFFGIAVVVGARRLRAR